MGPHPEYEIRITSYAERDLERLPSKDYSRIDRHVSLLAQSPRPRGVAKLRDKAHRIRTGAWRIIYIIDDAKRVVVIPQSVGERRTPTARSS